MNTKVPVVIIGGGQAGLSMSYYLKQEGIEHILFEKARPGEAWRTFRWDTFCLVTPNWQCQLPGFPYAGPDPFGFMVRDQIVDYLESYVRFFDPPLLQGVTVKKLSRATGGGFALATTVGEFTAEQVVIAVGGYHSPRIPRIAERFDANILHVHSSAYKNADALPEGAVLVVGTGQSGCQIAEDLHLAGRKVHLATGSAPRTARRYRGRDVVEWLHEMGYYDLPIHEHPQKDRVRDKANHYVTGRDGGRDIDLRKFANEGMQLYGRLQKMKGERLTFGEDLKANLDQADAVAEKIKTTIDEFIAKQGIDAPVEPRYTPVWEPPADAPRELDYRAAGITSVIWSVGFGRDYGWIDLPLFDGKGYPAHQRGVSVMPGIYFLGLPWLYTWGSGRFSGVARDARHLADCIKAKNHSDTQSSHDPVAEWALGS
ncbi:MAG TPA: MSMEG_0569 family flavin-dependent oxidoreductase [Chthoniobacteraceae bacterium]|jgi:putative flavoprotein involved in K+ transport|nr:MSMEG_0569 family flavin-dependent oxidoreductase [Chthoniobacteraceae bacterium]